MKFAQIYRRRKPIISFELFPPSTDKGMEKLQSRLPKLARLEPDFISVTYGAMGTTRQKTLEIVSMIQQDCGLETAHHLTCVGATRQELSLQLEQIRRQGIENIVALRGDPPRGQARFEPPQGGFSNAWELVAHVHSAGGFGVAVAGYPEKHVEASDFDTDLRHLKHKADCGADVIITQLFYHNAAYFRFVDRCREIGIEQPIVPGLLPILSLRQIQRIAGLCGCILPVDLMEELKNVEGDEDKVFEIGIEYTVEQAKELLDRGVPGIHFYVLNRYFHIAEVMQELRPKLDQLQMSAP